MNPLQFDKFQTGYAKDKWLAKLLSQYLHHTHHHSIIIIIIIITVMIRVLSIQYQ